MDFREYALKAQSDRLSPQGFDPTKPPTKPATVNDSSGAMMFYDTPLPQHRRFDANDSVESDRPAPSSGGYQLPQHRRFG